jgi:hypothetical protein
MMRDFVVLSVLAKVDMAFCQPLHPEDNAISFGPGVNRSNRDVDASVDANFGFARDTSHTTEARFA